MNNEYGPFIVWVDYGMEGWKPKHCATFQNAVDQRENLMGCGSSRVIITEYVPLLILDKREISLKKYREKLTKGEG